MSDTNAAPKIVNFAQSAVADLSAKDQEIMGKMKATMQKVIEAYVRESDRIIGERLKTLLGETPSPDELKKHGTVGVHPDGSREYQWDGISFLIIPPIGL